MKKIFNCSKTSPSSIFDMHRRTKVEIDEKKITDHYLTLNFKKIKKIKKTKKKKKKIK